MRHPVPATKYSMRNLIDMFDTKPSDSLLLELDYQDRVPLFRKLEAYRGKFIHFSKIDKIGVNPNKSHKDPHGVYFYPVDWILDNDTERMSSGDQYGVDWPYYFIADINLSSNGVVLSHMTWDQLFSIMKRNNWGGIADTLMTVDTQERPNYIKSILNYPYLKVESPGSVFFTLADHLQMKGKATWASLLKGIDYIYDDENSIVHSNEPAQIIALTPKVIRLIHKGNQLSTPKNSVTYVVQRIIGDLHEKYGGTLLWKNKVQSLTLTKGDRSITINGDPKSVKHAESQRIRWEKIDGIKKDGESMEIGYYTKETYKQIFGKIDNEVLNFFENGIAIDTDKFFNLEEAKNFMLSEMVDRDGSWELSDGVDGYHLVWKNDSTIDGIPFESYFMLRVYGDGFSISVIVNVNEVNVYSIQSPFQASYNDKNKMLEELQHIIDQAIDSKNYLYGPESRRYPKFYNREELEAANGFMLKNSGIRMLSNNPSIGYLIDKYDALSERDKKDIIYDISKVITNKSY